MSVNVQLAILHICLVVKEKKTKKAAKNNDQMTKFLQHLESSGKFRKKNYLQDLYNYKMYRKVYRCI